MLKKKRKGRKNEYSKFIIVENDEKRRSRGEKNGKGIVNHASGKGAEGSNGKGGLEGPLCRGQL